MIIKKSAIELLSQISVLLSRDAESERGLMFGYRTSLSLGLFALICHIFTPVPVNFGTLITLKKGVRLPTNPEF